MARKLTYHELEQTVGELEHDLLTFKNAKEDAVKAKELLAHIFNAVPDCIVAIDDQYKIQWVNKSLAEKLKCAPEKLVGNFCYQCICKADPPPSACPHAKLLRGGKVYISENSYKQLGMNVLVTSSPLYDDEGKLIGGVHIIRDTQYIRKTINH
jgi:transcriptional regulator with PAS, ATPase and Fis domain